MSELTDWFKALPLFTRHWFGLTIALSLLGRFGILSPIYLILDYTSLFHSFHVSYLNFTIIESSTIDNQFYYRTSDFKCILKIN